MIDELFDRNAAWALRKTKEDPGYFRRLAAQQAPRFLWIGCSDSRVPANEIVGLDPGELFVHRNVANLMHTGDLNLLSVLEFAVEALQVEHVIVCGHYGCGGVRRALAGQGGALVDHWLAPIVNLHARERRRFDPIMDEEARVNLLCELNVEMQVSRISATPILQAAWREERRIAVHGWIYGLKDGLLRDLGVSQDGRAAPSSSSDGTAPPCVDPAPVDDWSEHVRMGAIHLLEAADRCGCSDARLVRRRAEPIREAAE
jgi:carbonic anhydrase